MAKLTTGQKIFWGIGVGVVAIVTYRMIFKPKDEPFVIDETTSNATGCSNGLVWCEFSQSCTPPSHCNSSTRKK